MVTYEELVQEVREIGLHMSGQRMVIEDLRAQLADRDARIKALEEAARAALALLVEYVEDDTPPCIENTVKAQLRAAITEANHDMP